MCLQSFFLNLYAGAGTSSIAPEDQSRGGDGEEIIRSSVAIDPRAGAGIFYCIQYNIIVATTHHTSCNFTHIHHFVLSITFLNLYGGSGTTSNVPEDQSGGGDSEEIIRSPVAIDTRAGAGIFCCIQHNIIVATIHHTSCNFAHTHHSVLSITFLNLYAGSGTT